MKRRKAKGKGQRSELAAQHVPLEFTVPSDFDGHRLDRFLVSVLGRSFPIADSEADRRRARHGRAPRRPRQPDDARGRSGNDRICQRSSRPSLAGEALPLEILYQDGDIAVLNKPAGMVVHPGAGHASGTLVNALLHHIQDLSGIGGEARPGIVHRLDRGTSGVMVIAKNDAAHQELARQFHDREVEKEYVALVWGVVQAGRRIDAAIGRDPVQSAEDVCAGQTMRAHAVTTDHAGASSPRRDIVPGGDPHRPHSSDSRAPERNRTSRSSAIRCTGGCTGASPEIFERCSAWSGRSCTRSGSRSRIRVTGSGWNSRPRCPTTWWQSRSAWLGQADRSLAARASETKTNERSLKMHHGTADCPVANPEGVRGTDLQRQRGIDHAAAWRTAGSGNRPPPGIRRADSGDGRRRDRAGAAVPRTPSVGGRGNCRPAASSAGRIRLRRPPANATRRSG